MNPPASRFRALGSAVVVMTTDADALPAVVGAVRAEIDAVDAACSRFRPDSELMALNAASGRAVKVSPLLARAIESALRAAVLTDGLVDPTVGTSLRTLGYDRDFRSVPPDGPPLHIQLRPVPGWRRVQLDPAARVARLAEGVELDFGATAKALAVDLAVAAAHAATDAGILVSIGGDLAVAGTPWPGGWPVLVTDDHATDPTGPGQTVGVHMGGLATSGTTVRRWRRGEVELHHVIDPRTGRPASVCWRTATVAAGSCVDANIASTAAVVMGEAAPAWLQERALPSRLVRPDGTVTVVAGWPEDLAVAGVSQVGGA